MSTSMYPQQEMCHSNSKLMKYNKINPNYSKMSNMRIIQKHLVYVIGLSSKYAFTNVNFLFNLIYIIRIF